MSTTYSIYCKTCEEAHPHEANSYQIPMLRHLIDRRQLIVDTLPLINAPGAGYIELTIDGGRGPFVPDWFKAHLEHELGIIDGYGRFVDACQRNVVCSECGTQHSCTLNEGHEGACKYEKRK